MPFGIGGHNRDDSESRGRGREDRAPVSSTGRGGAGNAVRSPSRGRPAVSAEEERKALAYHEKQQHVRAGRGGAGNVRSPSRDPGQRQKEAEADVREQQMQAAAIKHDQHAVHSSGRGGMGNMAHSRDDSPRGREGTIDSAIRSMSRSRSRDARSSSRPRGSAAGAGEDANGDKLGTVDETASTVNGDHSSTTASKHSKGGFMSKIANVLPSSHSQAQHTHANGKS